MPIVEITPSEDQRLIKVVPEFLQGQQCAAKRVRWVIAEYLRILGVGHGSESGPARKAGAPGEGDGADATHVR